MDSYVHNLVVMHRAQSAASLLATTWKFYRRPHILDILAVGFCKLREHILLFHYVCRGGDRPMEKESRPRGGTRPN